MKIQSNEKIETVKGQIVLPDDPNYNEVREIWNAMIDRRPAVIVQCAEADDVPHAISYARENGLEISIRGGGHNIAGSSLCDNGVVIDFSNMTTVSVDAQKRRAYVEPGATLG
ncbi:MAG: FAD-dependent oxidoreductase, partial [Deltaproteobacteria bacterium]|nr:FAD-dependent oxidoreductase [Deltaproteobacteria bacterium]